MNFTVTHTDGNARAGLLETFRGSIQTPVFMPVATRGAVRAQTGRDLEEIGFEIILSNTYHMYIRPGTELLMEAGGLHSFMDYSGPILTDSGGYQVFSLSDLCRVHENGVEFRSHIDGSPHFFSPELVLDIQEVIGSDIMMVLDQCTDYPIPLDEAWQAVERTVQWARQSIEYWKGRFDTGRQSLFAIVQGSVYPELRRECAGMLTEMDFSGFAVGGLSVGEPKDLYRENTAETLKHLPPEKPRYMMGIGSPMEILFAVREGVDMFDSVMPTRIARNGTIYTSRGRINIKTSEYERDYSPLDDQCGCYVCRRFTRSYLRHLFRMGEIASLVYNTYHNLYFMKQFMDGIRKSIVTGQFGDEQRRWESFYS